MAFIILVYLAIIVLLAASVWKVFEKAGRPGWEAIVPFYKKSFGKDEGFTVGMIFLGIVFWAILAFGSAQYIGPYGDPEAYNAATNPELDFNGK